MICLFLLNIKVLLLRGSIGYLFFLLLLTYKISFTMSRNSTSTQCALFKFSFLVVHPIFFFAENFALMAHMPIPKHFRLKSFFSRKTSHQINVIVWFSWRCPAANNSPSSSCKRIRLHISTLHNLHISSYCCCCCLPFHIKSPVAKIFIFCEKRTRGNFLADWIWE